MSTAGSMVSATLAELDLMSLPHAGPAPVADRVINGLAVDSREVKDGFLFVAMPGTKLDGASFAQYAVRQGAAAIIVTPEGLEIAKADIGALPIPFLIHHNPRAELARLSALWNGAQPGVMAAVTGTNGKTSVAHFLRQIWHALGLKPATFGTAGVEGPGFEEPLAMTTPEPLALHALLARLADKGCTHAAMEASSHGLAQHRVDGVRFMAAGLTNITRDHMDYHRDHDDYVGAKLRLFHDVLPPDGVAVLNADDPVFPLARMIAGPRRVIRVGRGSADLHLAKADYHRDGQVIAFDWEGRRHTADLALIGGFQAENVLMAAGLAIATEADAEAVFATLPKLTGVRGRMERAAARENGAAIYVDYAHTPDALSTTLAAIRPHVSGRLVVVGGAGGDRDPGKRPLMGSAMAAGADVVIVTDDNPRSEDPAAIRAAVMEGCPDANNIGDRAEAILTGVDALKSPGDCLLIAGKGHEQGQELAGRTLPFDDVSQARVAVAALDGLALEETA
ncbi:MAG: UDP-N-acetylmuramoyl-L-alanyl-D-glutamate--2,6-diaminopimelate ligase [Pseudomonadota bacterium]